MLRKLLFTNFIKISFPSRCYATRYYNKQDGVFYPGGFTYYPKDKNEKDEPYEPTKLFMVKRIKPFKGNPHWEKKILKGFKLDEKGIAIVKNIPENNGRLWRIKHLVKITPIKFPNGEPTEDDLNSTYLRENGDFLVSKRLEIPETRLEASNKCEKNPEKLDGDTLRRQSRRKWLSGW